MQPTNHVLSHEFIRLYELFFYYIENRNSIFYVRGIFVNIFFSFISISKLHCMIQIPVFII